MSLDGNRDLLVFLIILVINTIIAIIYLLFNILRKKQNKPGVFMRTFVILVVPIGGMVFLFFSQLFFRLFFRKAVSLTDVVFSKERVQTYVHADEDRERNIVPIEEAIKVTETGALRTFMMSVVRGDIQNSLAAIMLALDSEDSETSHYAAAVLQDELNNFRDKVDRDCAILFRDDASEAEYISANPNYAGKPIADLAVTNTDGTDIDPYKDASGAMVERIDSALAMLDYMNMFLEQQLLPELEQRGYVKKMSSVGDLCYHLAATQMQSSQYEAICLRNLESELYEDCQLWCDRSNEVYPNTLSSYTVRLKLLFNTGRRDEFRRVLDELKNSAIVIDSKTLELIRVFQ